MDARPYLITVINAINSNTDYGLSRYYKIYDKPHQVTRIVDILAAQYTISSNCIVLLMREHPMDNSKLLNLPHFAIATTMRIFWCLI